MYSAPVTASRAARLALVLALIATPAWAQGDVDALSQGLIRLRGEVEQLNSELELLREEQRTTLAGLSAQKAELTASAERQQLLVREARRKLESHRESTSSESVSGDAMMPLLHDAIDSLARQIRAGLPFKQEERLGELETLRAQLGNGSVPPQRAVNRLWAFYEDEFRLTRDNSLHAQTITLGDERVLADVAKLGSMALYFQTQDGHLGMARKSGADWRFVQIEESAMQAQVLALFDALRKQIRQGYFELPLAIAENAR